jgi:hypothetical protein
MSSVVEQEIEEQDDQSIDLSALPENIRTNQRIVDKLKACQSTRKSNVHNVRIKSVQARLAEQEATHQGLRREESEDDYITVALPHRVVENKKFGGPENRRIREILINPRTPAEEKRALMQKLISEHMAAQRAKGNIIQSEHGLIKGPNFEPHPIPEVHAAIYGLPSPPISHNPARF